MADKVKADPRLENAAKVYGQNDKLVQQLYGYDQKRALLLQFVEKGKLEVEGGAIEAYTPKGAVEVSKLVDEVVKVYGEIKKMKTSGYVKKLAKIVKKNIDVAKKKADVMLRKYVSENADRISVFYKDMKDDALKALKEIGSEQGYAMKLIQKYKN